MDTKLTRPRAFEIRKKCKYFFFHWRRFRNEELWCKCDTRRLSRGWTSNHPGIDKFIKETQRNTRDWMDPYLEWIPYERLDNVEKIGEGGFSVVYSAEWGDIKKRISWPSKNKSLPVALKRLKGSSEMSENFIDELRTYHRCISTPPSTEDKVKYDHGFLRFFGITQDPRTKDYAMVTELASLRDVRHQLDQMFSDIYWSDKLYWLQNISRNLVTIHENGYTHRNLHPGNILIGQIKDGTTVAKLSHLGLSRPASDNVDKMLNGEKQNAETQNSNYSKDFYGVVPYIAPEILIGQQYTKAADIYSLGIIMAEISTGIPPFVDRAHDEQLALEICNGLRPEFAKGTPQSYIDLAKRCWNENPAERPEARDLLNMFHQWWDLTQDSEIPDDTFSQADKYISEQKREYTRHPGAIYVSRKINFEVLSTGNTETEVKISTGGSF